jgi:endogenous inhibitor of DNA gyrase (YacG/DUF329 family)
MGRWIERNPGYLSFDVFNCTYCGKLIPRHIWLEALDGVERPFCNASCHEQLLRKQARKNQQIDSEPQATVAP